MKKLLLVCAAIAMVASSCTNSSNGQVIGVQGRVLWYQPDPYGMLYLPMGSYNMGLNDQDAPYAHTTRAKTVSVQAFYMDQTEITNNEYRQFVDYVRDSIVHRILGTTDFEEHLITENKYAEEYDDEEDYRINWNERIEWEDAEVRTILDEEGMYYSKEERYYRRRELDTRRFNFEYFWIDIREAARKKNRYYFLDEDEEGETHSSWEYGGGITSRADFIRRDVINVYPDTLCWVHDFTYSFNEPMTNMYFWHPAYDDYPVVGVTWKQARAFSIWRTQYLNRYLRSVSGIYVQDFRLPTESEWEYAARGGLDLSSYPWGGPYIRNSRGCFLGNFKPLRGNYVDDGGFHTVKVTSYSPNDYGLYCMAGNVSEWTSNAYDESAYDFAHDLNMDYQYDAKPDDPPVLKRKVIRGGSWKDIGFYMQTGARTYEYQDTAKCYIGFRCVMSYLGRAVGDDI